MNKISSVNKFASISLIIAGLFFLIHSFIVQFEIDGLDKSLFYKTSGEIKSFSCRTRKGMSVIKMTIIIEKLKIPLKITRNPPKCKVVNAWAIGKSAIVYSSNPFNEQTIMRDEDVRVWELDIGDKKVIPFDEKIQTILSYANRGLYVGLLLIIFSIAFYCWLLVKKI